MHNSARLRDCSERPMLSNLLCKSGLCVLILMYTWFLINILNILPGGTKVNRYIRVQIGALLLIFLGGCGPVTMTQLIAEGKQPLTQKQLADLVPNATIHLQSIDFDGDIHYQPDGRLTAGNKLNEKEHGQWQIDRDNRLCMKFTRWYYGDLRCYRIVNESADTYVFFTTNGARAYTGRLQSSPKATAATTGNQPAEGAPQNASGTAAAEHRAPDRSGPPKISEQEMKISLTYMARNCPGCNLSGADLQNAQLVSANLAGANLSNIDLSGANLRRANLAGANLAGARLIRTNLSGADMSGCNLSGADLTGSNLTRANMTDATLQGAVFSGALIENTQGLKKDI